MTQTKYPTKPEIVYRGEMSYEIWKNDYRWWVANACGQEWHGCCRESVEVLAQEAIDEYMEDDANWPQ